MAQASPSPCDQPRSSPPEWFVIVFALAVFVSAFLLFQVQPLISKFILPWFGGAPGVWTTAMLFFQVLLFLGYTYSHLTSKFLGLRGQTVIHLGLLVAALLTLPIIPPETWKPTADAEPTWRILGLLAATVGLPYFLLSSTGPLLQAWFARAYLGRSPYRLYALSNVGSLLALVSYPVVIEPLVELPRQAWLWSAGFVLYGFTVACCALWGLRGAVGRQDAVPSNALRSESGEDSVGAPSWLQRAAWVALPALGSLMLLATTNRVCQDVAVVPFLWVIPLGLYLLSFVICFDHERWYRRGFWAAATLVLIFVTDGSNFISWVNDLSICQDLTLYFATMFGTCMVCHGELVRLRPGTKHVTEFYLLMSAGGALGGVLVSLVAPQVFTAFYEWNIGLLMAFLLALWGVCQALAEACQRRVVPSPRAWFATVLSSLACAVILSAGAVGTYDIVDFLQPGAEALHRARNFYGRVAVVEECADEPQRRHCAFYSGRINHGQEFCLPEKRTQPTAYYAEHTGVGRALLYARQRGPLRVGVVGLGVGTLATYVRPGDYFRFYELNPEVTYIARTWFHFLPACPGRCEVVGGDARMSLEREQDEPFDVLVLDAFSGDAIPVHLLTREAFEVYVRRLKPDGLLVVHITNTYLTLSPIVQRLADHFRFRTTRIVTPLDEDRLQFRADFMVLTKDDAFIKQTPPEIPADWLEPQVDGPLWTDHFSNLFQILKRA
jgi:hypothetical protein